MENLGTKLAGLALATSVALGAGVAIAHTADAQIDRMQHRDERLQELIDDGVITEDRAEEIRSRMAERAVQRGDRHEARSERLEKLAATLGMTADDLKADLQAGASLADIAEAAGVDIDTIIDKIETAKAARINQAVIDGHIDQTQADEMLNALRDRITDRVNGERPERFRGPRPGR